MQAKQKSTRGTINNRLYSQVPGKLTYFLSNLQYIKSLLISWPQVQETKRRYHDLTSRRKIGFWLKKLESKQGDRIGRAKNNFEDLRRNSSRRFKPSVPEKGILSPKNGGRCNGGLQRLSTRRTKSTKVLSLKTISNSLPRPKFLWTRLSLTRCAFNDCRQSEEDDHWLCERVE